MRLFGHGKTGGVMDVIRCDEPSYLIWKWHPIGSKAGNNRRENAIRWGSTLRVKDGEVAVFVYWQKNGTMQDYIEGPWDKVLETSNLPVLSSIIGLAYDGNSPFQAEVYFINLAHVIQVKFAVPYFNVYDPRFLDFGVPVAVRGTISFRISDYKKFIKLHRLNSFSLEEFQKQISDSVIRYTKDIVANAPAANDIPVVQLESKTAQINDEIEFSVRERLEENFGVLVSGVDISSIDIDKSSDEYHQLMTVTRDLSADITKAKSAAGVKDIYEKQYIDAQNYEESLRIQREENQYAQHKQTQSANFSAFQTEQQNEVGVAAAEALGKMGENGAGSVNMGGSSFNPAAVMAGMALGGTVGRNVSNMLDATMLGMNQAERADMPVPPPIPNIVYHVAVDGQATGPYNLQQLQELASLGRILPTTLVWTAGMAEWKRISDLGDLKNVLKCIPPSVPS